MPAKSTNLKNNISLELSHYLYEILQSWNSEILRNNVISLIDGRLDGWSHDNNPILDAKRSPGHHHHHHHHFHDHHHHPHHHMSVIRGSMGQTVAIQCYTTLKYWLSTIFFWYSSVQVWKPMMMICTYMKVIIQSMEVPTWYPQVHGKKLMSSSSRGSMHNGHWMKILNVLKKYKKTLI